LNLSKVRVNFVLFLSQKVFDRFLTFFLSQGPLIHLLYKEMTELYRNIRLLFLKSDSVQHSSGQNLLNIGLEQSALWISDIELELASLIKVFFH